MNCPSVPSCIFLFQCGVLIWMPRVTMCRLMFLFLLRRNYEEVGFCYISGGSWNESISAVWVTVPGVLKGVNFCSNAVCTVRVLKGVNFHMHYAGVLKGVNFHMHYAGVLKGVQICCMVGVLKGVNLCRGLEMGQFLFLHWIHSLEHQKGSLHGRVLKGVNFCKGLEMGQFLLLALNSLTGASKGFSAC